MSPDNAEHLSPPTSEIDTAPPGMDRRVDLALALCTVALGVYVIAYAQTVRIGSFPDPLSTRGLPLIAGLLMTVIGAILAGRRIWHWRHERTDLVAAEGAVDEAGHAASSRRTFGIVVLAFAWVAVLPVTGYLLTTPLMLAGMLWLMDVRSPRRLVLFPLGFTLVIWLLFSQVLGVIVPLGFMTPWFRSIGLIP